MAFSFPLLFSKFIRKRNAAFDGDPEGDYVIAEDDNELQESIERLEQVIGLENLKETVSTTLKNKANKSDLGEFGSPLFINYNGNSINAYNTAEKRINAFSYTPHVMLRKEDTTSFVTITQAIKQSGTTLYGLITTSSTDTATLKSNIQWFKDKNFDGVLFDKFGFENGLNRSLQNSLLDFAHDLGLVVIITGEIETTIFNRNHANNPLQEDLHISAGDIYLAQNVFITNGVKNEPSVIVSKTFSLNKAQKEKGIKVFVEDTADILDSNSTLYEHGRLLSTLYNLDGYSLPPVSHYALNEQIQRQSTGFELGSWQSNTPIYVEDSLTVARSISKGVIVFDKEKNTCYVKGVGISPNIYTWKDKQIPGEAIMLETADYNSETVAEIVSGINESQSLIHYSKIDGLTGSGASPNTIKDVVVRAINNSPAALTQNPPNGYDELAANNFIHGGVIDYLDASAIKSGDLQIDNLKANVIEAVNAHIGEATIDSAKIGRLQTDHITATVVDAINIYAENAGINRAVINSAAIGQLTADHIKGIVVEAINFYAGSAVIESARIGELAAEKISTNVIKAINASISDAVIDSAKVGVLTAAHIKATVVDAINLYAGEAKIDAAHIGELNADNITAGIIEALQVSATNAEFDNLKSSIIDVINASIQQAFIDGAIISDGTIIDAKIVSLVANKISAGTIDTGQVTLQGENGHLRITGNRLQVFDDQTIPVERVSIGDVNVDGTVFGLRVRGADGQTVLYDEKGVYSEGLTDGAVTNPKIAEGAVDGNKHIAANTITADKMVADQITAREVAARSLTANELAVGTITSQSAVIAEGAIGSAEIGSAVINDGHIQSLNANKITAGKISAQHVEIGPSTQFQTGYSPEELKQAMEAKIPFFVSVWAPQGNMFKNALDSTTLSVQADLYKSGVIQTTGVTYEWYIQVTGASDTGGGAGWTKLTSSNQSSFGITGTVTSKTITVSASKITNMAVYKVKATTNSVSVWDSIVIYDQTDPIEVVLDSSKGTIFRNGEVQSRLTCRLYQGGAEIDPVLSSATSGYKYTYTWSKYNKDGVQDTTFGKTGKWIEITSNDVYMKSVFKVDIS